MGWYPSNKDGSCLLTNRAGFPYESLPCLYPSTIGRTYFEWVFFVSRCNLLVLFKKPTLSILYWIPSFSFWFFPILFCSLFSFEKQKQSFEVKYDPVLVRDWMVSNPWCPILAVILYGVFIGIGKSYFESRPAWNWRNSMALWNLGLSVFSFLGFLRTAPQLFHNLLNYSITENLCFDPESHFGSGGTGFWVQLFCLSKFPYVPSSSNAGVLFSCVRLSFVFNVLTMSFDSLFFTLSLPGNWLIHSSSSSIRSHLSSCIGIIIFRSYSIVGMPL